MSNQRQERKHETISKGSVAPKVTTTTGPAAAEAALKRHLDPQSPKLLSEQANADSDPERKQKVSAKKSPPAKWKRYTQLGLFILLGTSILGIGEGLVLFNSRPPSVGIPKKSYETRDDRPQANEQGDNAPSDNALLARIADLEKKLASVTRERDVLKEALLMLRSGN